MVAIATLLWQQNDRSKAFSSMYDEEWVERLYRGFARNITRHQWRMVVFTDRDRSFGWPIDQVRIKAKVPDYSTCIEPYALNEPMLLCGLDTVVTGNIDHLLDSCLQRKCLGLPRDPYQPKIACNGVALVPAGMRHIAELHKGQNDMEWVRNFAHTFLDDEFPGHVVSYKGHVLRYGLGDARIVYFHGEQKPHQLKDSPWVREHWR